MRRREFITLFGGVTVAPSLFWPRVARAQQPRRVGLLINGAETKMLPPTYVAAFVQEMRQLGWIDGQNIRFDLRWNGGDAELAPRTYAAQLVGLQPDVLADRIDDQPASHSCRHQHHSVAFTYIPVPESSLEVSSTV